MRNLLAVGAVCLLAAAATVRAQETKLSFVDAPALVDCDGRPCLWIRIDRNRTDASGAAVGLPRNASDYKVVDLRGPTPLVVFYVTDATNADKAQPKQRYSLLLFDLSGSMANKVASGGRESRFSAAVNALRGVISTHFTEGVDHWAIVGFESHDVVRRIERARFVATRREARDQLDALPAPAVRNNTALFSAIDSALPILKEQKTAGNEVRLIVFTDGKNDVRPADGDDRGLLTDDMGRRRLIDVDAKERNGIEIIPIGFGIRGAPDFDEQTLRELAYPRASNYHYAADGERLAEVFRSDQDQLAMRVRLSVLLPAKEKNELTQKIPLRVSLRGEDGADSAGSEIPFTKKGVTPSWEGQISGKEKAAYDDLLNPPGPDRLLTKLLIFAGFLGFFALAWFGLPRLAWPESYIPRPKLPGMPAVAGLESAPKPPSFRRDAPPQPQRPAPRAPTRSDVPSPRRGSAPEEWRPSQPPDDDATQYLGGAPPSGRGRDAGPPSGDSPKRPASDGPAPGRPAGPQPVRDRPGAEPPRSADDATVYFPRGKKYEQDT